MHKLRQSKMWLLTLVLAGLFLAACGGEAGSGAATENTAGGAEDDTDFFEGKTITFVVPFSPGGGFDTYARMIAPYLEEELGATVVVENRPGAGGLLAINQLTAAESDGLTMAIMNGPGAGGASLAGSSSVQFRLEDLDIIGLFQGEGYMFAVGPDAPFESFEDVRKADLVRIGTTGPGAADFINANALVNVFGLNGEIISGYDGSSENALAATRGDVDGMVADYGSGLNAVKSGDLNALLALSREPLPELPDVPLVLDQEFPSPDAKDLMDAHLKLVVEFIRPIVAPANVPEDRLEVLRTAMDTVAANKEFQEAMDKAGRATNYLSGEEADALVEELLDAPPAYVDLLEKAYQ